MTVTAIEWCDVTWNPVRGCARVSPGCERCYAERQAHRFHGVGQPYEGLTVLGKHGPRWAGRARFVPEMFSRPLEWRKPQRVFVNSMSDLFHDDITNDQIAAVFGVLAACPHLTFQVLTKRPDRMRDWFRWVARVGRDLPGTVGEDLPEGLFAEPAACLMIADRYLDHEESKLLRPAYRAQWPLPNVWIGVSCEDQQRADERIPLLVNTPAAVRFVSAEPLIASITLRERWFTHVDACNGCSPDAALCPGHVRAGIDWVIVGGESGSGARSCGVDWIRDIVKQCSSAGVACFVKQLGAAYVDALNAVGGAQTPAVPEYGPIARLRDRKGGDMSEWPADLRVRQFPAAREPGALQ